MLTVAFFKDWAEKDLINEYYNHRNHPSIVMWSIGNEIPDQKTKEVRRLAVVLWIFSINSTPHVPLRPGR